MAKYLHSLFLFHRDLRLHDNTGLMRAQTLSREVTPLFIFDNVQTSPHPYKSEPGFVFLIESLKELENDIRKNGGKLLFCKGNTLEVLERLLSDFKVDAIFSNRDYTPFARARDNAIEILCRSQKREFHLFGDSLLHEPEEVLKDNGTPYTVYTPYAKKAAKIAVRSPQKNTGTNFTTISTPFPYETTLESYFSTLTSPHLHPGGRAACKEILKGLKSYLHLKETRDFPAKNSTTRLSPHLKFGTCSSREIFHTVARDLTIDHVIIRELYWRDFFSQIAFHFPHVFEGPFHKAYAEIEWDTDDEKFSRWKNGTTGFPIVDAGMRELNATGFMHNRVRMITGSFLIKDLHIDWRWGERYFAQRLVDYDPSVNNGNWQWVASSGCDAQPYFRIFNPWLQQEKFDPECLYIKRWIPELKNTTPDKLHRGAEGTLSEIKGYSPPILNHAFEKKVTEDRYSVVKKK